MKHISITNVLRKIKEYAINAFQMIGAAMALLLALILVTDWYDHPDHVYNLLFSGFILYKIVLRFIISVEYGNKGDLQD